MCWCGAEEARRAHDPQAGGSKPSISILLQLIKIKLKNI
jgi:hypothetical protein